MFQNREIFCYMSWKKKKKNLEFNDLEFNEPLFITQDKRRNERNLVHCVDSTFKLYVTCKGVKRQV